ncbi:MAG: hypothetical protein M5R36_19090 [Deltaproteobacteria bacterium]|nr:hypothetical protein [Deltaproteobacteria bacterium]
MFAILFTAALSRYLPGKVWIFVGQVNAASRMGYKPSTTLAASAVQNIVGNLSNVIMLGVFAALSKRFQVIAWPAFALATVGTVVLFASPAWVEARFNAWRAKRGGEPVRIAVGRASIAKAYVLMLFAWVEHALAFVALVASATPLAWAAAFDLGLAYMLAYQAGFVAFVVPGGLGVREAALTAMLGGVLGAGAAGLVATAQRLWFLVAELMALPFALWMLRRESSGAG